MKDMKLSKIKTKKELERKERKRKAAFALLIIFLLALSTAGFALYGRQEQETRKYKNFKFVRQDNSWTTTIQGKEIATSFLPQEVENISSYLFFTYKDFSDKIYFVAFETEEKIALNEILGNIQPYNAQKACLEEQAELAECVDLPLKNCSDSKIFIIRESNITEVRQEENCIFVEGNSTNLLKAADKAIFELFGIR